MARGYYINYIFEYRKIFEKINQYKYQKINFFIDLQSIATGFYNKDTILIEISKYAENNEISNLLLTEYYKYLQNLYIKFKQYDPYFITFYDDGYCSQNKTIQKNYKSGSGIQHSLLLEQDQIQLFRNIKKYYFEQIQKKFTNNISKIFYLKQYESDFIPYYCLKNNLFDSQESNVINIILSKDKDLLQCCQWKNTYQIVSMFQRGIGKRAEYIFDDVNAISYIHKKFKPGILTSKHIPLLLALSGDQADGVAGIKGIGPSGAVKLLESMFSNMPSTSLDLQTYTKMDKLPKVVQENIDLVINSFKLTSFEEQLQRIPINYLENV